MYSFVIAEEEVYKLHLSRPWKNPYLVVVIPSKDKNATPMTTDELVETIKIYLPIPDSLMWRMGRNRKKISASLLPEKTGIVLRMPSMASAMVYAFHVVHFQEDPVDLSAKTNHESIAAHYHNNAAVQFKEVTFMFPKSMRGSNRHFNGTIADPKNRKLVTNFRFADVDLEHKDENGNKIQLVCPYVFWKIVVDGPFRTTAFESDNSSDEERAYGRLLATRRVLAAAEAANQDDDDGM